MLHLQCETQQRWLEQVDSNLEEILIDHAHCEQKAAATAMSLLGAYVQNADLTREMTVIIQEELEHFHQVLAILDRRGIELRRLKAAQYGRRLAGLIRPHHPDRAVDRLLVASLIEARSCERFHLLRRHVTDPELSEFYGSLFESEARHHTTYVRLAKQFATPEVVRARLEELSAAESDIIRDGDPLPRMHS